MAVEKLDNQDALIGVLSAALALAVIVYMLLKSKVPSATSSTLTGAPSTVIPVTPPPVDDINQAPAVDSTPAASPFSLPNITAPGNSITINSGARLFPLFGYAAG